MESNDASILKRHDRETKRMRERERKKIGRETIATSEHDLKNKMADFLCCLLRMRVESVG